MKKGMDYAGRILFYAFFIFGILMFIFGWGRTTTLVFAFCSFAASWAITIVIKNKGIKNGDTYILLVNFALWFNLLGEMVFYYHGLEFPGLLYYDKILHLAIGILITAIIYQFYAKSLKVDKLMIFCSVLGMFTIWEIYEYLLMIFLSYPTMGVINGNTLLMSPLDDTMIDLIMGSIGALSFLFLKKEEVAEKINKVYKKVSRKIIKKK